MIYRPILLVIALLVCLPVSLLAQSYEGDKGDVNNDGTVDLLDILETVNIVLGTKIPDNDEFWRADCNAPEGSCEGDGSVNLLDIVKIANIILGFDSCPSTTVTDIDGNAYQTVTIGGQVWMAENLKVTRYRSGDTIPNVTSNSEWTNLTTGARCDYDNDADNVPVYGRLYNWYAVNDSRGIAPEGWHVATFDELWILVDYLGGNSVAGGKMKTTGTIEGGTGFWYSPNTGATNESGFSALPGGYRYYYSGTFRYMGYNAFFWSSTDIHNGMPCYWNLWNLSSNVYGFHTIEEGGFSVRCVRD